MIKISKKCLSCPYSVFFDTYSGCSHGCSYCFVKNYKNIDNIKIDTTPKTVLDFINGKRNTITNWVRKGFPLRWGVLSDPFQPIEKTKKASLEILKVFAKTGYPFIVTTKSSLIRDNEYKDIFKDCNFILQVSMTSPRVTEKFEKGLSNFNERLDMLDDFKNIAFKTVVRCAPMFLEELNTVLALLPKYRDAGVKLFQVDPYYSNARFNNSIKEGKNYYYKPDLQTKMLKIIKQECHKNNLMFGECVYENLSDTIGSCVGEDYGLFAGNKATDLYFLYDLVQFDYDKEQLQKGSGMFYHEIGRGGAFSRKNLSTYTYQDMYTYNLKKIKKGE